MKKTILFVLFLSTSLYTYTQNNLSGTVLDSETNLPISGVSVYFPELERGSITDEHGMYTIHRIPNGKYKLVASYLGYGSYTTTLSFPAENSLEIKLAPSAIEIEEVIVSTPFHKLQSENVVKVSRKGISELKNNGSITLADGIKSIAGVETVSTGVGIGKPVIRGLSSNRILVYTQGIRLENQQFGGEHGLGLSDSGVESIEVIKGPASLLYGSDALGGVLYINPERFELPGKTSGDISTDYFSNTQGFNASAGIKSSSDRLKFLLKGAFTTHKDYKTGNEISVSNSRFKEYDLKAGMGYQHQRFKTELRYNFNRSDLGIPEELTAPSGSRTPVEPFQELTNHILSSKSSMFFDRGSLDVTLGYIANDRKEFEEHHEEAGTEEAHHEEEEGPALHMKLKTLSYNALFHLPKTETLESILGIQGMYQTNENFGEELLIPDASTADFGVYATSHLHLNKYDIQLGIRFDRRHIDSERHGTPADDTFIEALDQSYNSFNAAIGLKTDLTKNLTSRFNLATGFRAPNLAELTSNGSHEGANRFEIGNADLDEEKNVQFDAALEYKNEHFELFVNGFYNAVNDYIFLMPNGAVIDQDPVYVYTQDNAKLYGGEIGMHLHPHPLDWLHLESSFETVTGKQGNGKYLPLIPAASLTNTFRVEFKREDKTFFDTYGFITLNSVFDQNKVSEFETDTNGYHLVHMGIGSKIKLNPKLPLEFRITANNLLDKDYVSHLSRLKPEGINNIGRNINIGLKATL